MPPMAEADYALEDRLLLARCRVERSRADGPGGQHVNRTESAIRVVHEASGLSAECREHREQPRNQAEALRRLRLQLALHQRGASDPDWVARRRRGRLLPVGPNADGFHLVAAAALDALVAADGALSPAAASLGISTTQLARLFVCDAELRRVADRIRAEHGLSALRV